MRRTQINITSSSHRVDLLKSLEHVHAFHLEGIRFVRRSAGLLLQLLAEDAFVRHERIKHPCSVDDH